VLNEIKKQLIKNLIMESFDEVFSDSFDKTIKATIQEKIIPKRGNTFEFIDVKVSSEMAWIAYQNHAVWLLEKTVYGKTDWLESTTVIRINEGWKLQMLHSTYIKTK
jgi:hypothetical protein